MQTYCSHRYASECAQMGSPGLSRGARRSAGSRDKVAAMTILRSMPSTSWTLLAALAGALTATACKKDSGETQPPDASAGDADAGDGSDAASSDDDDAAPEVLTVDAFEETIQARTGDVSDCFATAKEAKADLAGKLVYDFTIDGEGKVSAIVADPASTIKDEALNTCVRDKAKGWSFPKTRDGKPTTFPYKFNLS